MNGDSEPRVRQRRDFGEGDVRIHLDKQTYRRLQKGYLDAVDHGYTEDFETFVFNNTATTSRIVVDGETEADR